MMMVEPSGRVWIECDSFIDYLRIVEVSGRERAVAEFERQEMLNYAGLMAIQDTIRQIADSLVVTSMEAQDKMRGGRSEFGRRSGSVGKRGGE